ncbi:LuxR C-terminal-related transcriptional regulator [Paenibacillus profundus]|uniref:LuxR C-terminal-related transcriptional regulator n=1 Tax=Paenibacillus profundus TaxID=1173085 RepID=A0ABS8YGJ4_9BACL|nr:LuxR C-terminal-related transcriptional regulator [Paenibacillus profundus]MCE5170906.1 LuxR C-terminal-related transcriptional regulator [Paenibacillus profundus]
MMISTKIHPPRSRLPLVERERLLQLLDEGLNCKLTVVTAPAGFGKSTLLGAWASRHEHAAWVTLDRQENDWVSFWSYIMAAVGAAHQESGIQAEAMTSRINPRNPHIWMGEVIRVLTQLPAPFVIVLDDYHVIENEQIHRSMSYLLRHLPEYIHIYIGSRNEPPLRLPQLRLRGELHKVGMQELRFTGDEGAAFFQHCLSLPLARREADMLVARTEGWIGCMQLAALSLREKREYKEFIRHFSGQHRDVAEFLLMEVLDNQPERTKKFLLYTSICSRMSGPLCEAITGQAGGQTELEELERSHLFVIPLDDERGWYRYHYLFQDFLQAQLKKRFPGQATRLYALAGKWLEEHGLAEEAVEHYLLGEQYEDALRMIEGLRDQIAQSKLETMLRWLSAIPPRILNRTPQLDLFCICLLLYNGRLSEAEERIEVMEASLQQARNVESEAEHRLRSSALSLIRMMLAHHQRDFTAVLRYFEQCVDEVPESNSGILHLITHQLDLGLVDNNLIAHIGSLRVAEQIILRSIEVWEKKQHSAFAAVSYENYSHLLYEWNRLDEAEHWAALALKTKAESVPVALYAAFTMARILQVREAAPQALEIMLQLKNRYTVQEHGQAVQRISVELARLALAQGDIKQAEAWIQESGIDQLEDEFSLNQIYEYYVLAQTRVASGRYEEAILLLEKLNQLARQHSRQGDVVRTLALHSVAYYCAGNVQPAMHKLGEALEIAEEEGYIRSFTDEGAPMLELLAAYVRMRQTSFLRGEKFRVRLEYVKKLIGCLRQEHGDDETLKSSLLTGQELKVLQLIESELTNKEIAAELTVSVATIKTHINNIYRKMNVKSRFEAVHRGKELHLL